MNKMRTLRFIFVLIFISPFVALLLGALVSMDIAAWGLHVLEIKASALGIGLGLLTASFTAAIGASLAYAISFHQFPIKPVVAKLLLLPLLLPPFVIAAVYKDLFSASGPLVTQLGLPSALSFDFQSPAGFVFVMGFALLPYVYLLCRIAFEQLGRTFFEIGYSVGLSSLCAFRRLLLPAALPAVLLGTALVFAETAGNLDAATLLSVRTSAPVVHELWFSREQPGLAVGLSAIYILVALVALWFLGRMTRHRAAHYLPLATVERPLQRPCKEESPRKWWLTVCCLVPGIAGFVVPAVTIGYYFSKTVGVIDLSLLLENSFNSLKLVVAVLLILFVFSLFVSLRHRASKPSTGIMVRWLTVSYTVPSTVVAVGVLFLLRHLSVFDGRPGDFLSFLVLVCALAVRFAPFLVVPMFIGLSHSSREIGDTATALGLSGTRTYFRLHLPYIKRFAWLGALLVILKTAQETGISTVLSPFQFQTLVVKSYAYIQIDLLPESAAWIFSTMLLSIYPLLTIERLLVGRPAARS